MTALRGNKQGKRSPTEQDGVEGIRGAFPTEALGVTLGTPLPAHHAVSGGVLRSTLRPFSPPLSGTDSTQCWSNRSRSSRGLSSPHSPLKETPQQGGHSTGTRGSLRVHAAGLGQAGRSWAPCRSLHLQRGRLGDTHEQVYFFWGSGKYPRESYNVNRPRRMF